MASKKQATESTETTTPATDPIVALERRVSMLEEVVAKIQSAPAARQSGGSTQPLDFSKLSEPYANYEIRRDPARYDGPSMVGKTLADCSEEYLEKWVSYFEWKAAKGRAEVPVRMQNNGKPWFEADLFQAKLGATWLAFRRAGSPGASSGAESDEPWT